MVAARWGLGTRGSGLGNSEPRASSPESLAESPCGGRAPRGPAPRRHPRRRQAVHVVHLSHDSQEADAVSGARRVGSGMGEGALEVTADWVDAQGNALLREDTRFVFRAAAGSRAIDRITTLTALGEPVTFVDNKEGLIGMRVARALEQPSTTPEVFTDAGGHSTTVPKLDNDGVTGHYRSSEGLEGDSVWGTRGRWTMLSGVVQGEPVTLAILDHPNNVGFPTYWHARGYGLFAANPLGTKVFSNGKEELNFRLAQGQATTFRYRVLILSRTATPDQIETYYRDFTR